MKIYHYTSLESLALILKNKTLKFNCLKNMDDCEEGVSKDCGDFSNYIFVSSWTKDSRENIALWNMYSKEMTGIRIALDENFINYDSDNNYKFENRPIYILRNIKSDGNPIVLNWASNDICQSLIDVNYSDESRLFKESSIARRFDVISETKKKYWSFQKEARFILFATDRKKVNDIISQQKSKSTVDAVLSSIERHDEFNIDSIFLKLDDNAFNNIEVLLGPRSNPGTEILAESLLEKYCGNGNYKLERSNLKIK